MEQLKAIKMSDKMQPIWSGIVDECQGDINFIKDGESGFNLLMRYIKNRRLSKMKPSA